MPKINITLDEALKFYGLTEEHLYVRAVGEDEKPIYAVREYKDRIVFTLTAGPKLAFPPQTRAQCEMVPRARRALALRMAGLSEDVPEEEEDGEVSPIVQPAKAASRSRKRR